VVAARVPPVVAVVLAEIVGLVIAAKLESTATLLLVVSTFITLAVEAFCTWKAVVLLVEDLTMTFEEALLVVSVMSPVDEPVLRARLPLPELILTPVAPVVLPMVRD
jgi:hypothetical protein